MNLSEKTIKALQEVINGEIEYSNYRSGPKLIDFFNSFGRNDVYGENFPSRWDYTRKCIRSFNGTSTIKQIIEASVDPRDYIERNENKPNLSLEDTVNYLNQFLPFDSYELKKEEGKTTYKVFQSDGQIITSENLATLSHEFINEQIEKAEQKLANEDYDGAITNARSLVEAIQEQIIQKSGAEVPEYAGNLRTLYKTTRQTLNLATSKDLSNTLNQILSGLDSLVSGIAGLSNKMGDRHSRTYQPSRHHAKLAVNAAFTFCEFLLETYEYQQKQKNQKNKE